MSYTRIASIDRIKEAEIKRFLVNGRKVAVANIGGEFFAVDDTCTHAECSLTGEGFLDGGEIICGCHGARFRVADGCVLSLPATQDLRSYELKVKNGEIYVKI